MKLLFSEAGFDYARYFYPYVIWALPEPGETPADFYERGFLPSTPRLDRFYLCRNLRVVLSRFSPTSENRRILRKGAGISGRLVPRAEFAYTPERRAAWRAFAEARFGPGVMSEERLDALMAGRVITHLLHFTEEETGRDAGTVLMYVEPPRVAHYYYAFYNLDHFRRSLGLYMMTWAVRYFREHGLNCLHLGTCYSRRALYKTQFPGVEFFNGNVWSDNLDELKFLIEQTADAEKTAPLLARAEYLDRFWPAGLPALAEQSAFAILPESPSQK